MPEAAADEVVVMVVEDTADIAAYVELALGQRRPEVRVVKHVDNFEVLLTPEPWAGVDVALVDIMLPGVSGLDILAYLSDNHPNVRRVALTASTPSAADAERLADLVLLKPARIDDIADAIGDHTP